MTETARARAKINLCLHVTGQRTDGYHLLDSLVVFADTGDLIRCEAADTLSLRIEGPQAPGLPVSEDNLVLRAARAMGGHGAAITLDKHLPVSSGIGGGSADAAATLQALARLWDCPLPPAEKVLALGADVPVCLHGTACRMQGVGEVISPLPSALPSAHLLLVNPGIAVSTPAIFRQLAQKKNPPLPETLPAFATAQDLAAFLLAQRNDLEAPAIALAPVIANVRQTLAAQPDCLIARMSGSGATCFGLFAEADAAKLAANALRAAHPGWWVEAAAMV